MLLYLGHGSVMVMAMQKDTSTRDGGGRDEMKHIVVYLVTMVTSLAHA